MINDRKLLEREARKELILQGALNVFHKNGMEGATMDHIAEEAGFGKATLYYYFHSKEEVFCAIMEKGWKLLWEEIEESIHAKLNPKEKFLDILMQISNLILKYRNLYSFLFSAPSTITHLEDKLQSWKSYQNRLYATLRSLLDEGVSNGELPDVNPELFFRVIGGSFHGLFTMGNAKKKLSKTDIEKLFSQLLTSSKAI